MNRKFKRGDTVRIPSGDNKGVEAMVVETTMSSGGQLYLVEWERFSEWIPESDLVLMDWPGDGEPA